MAVPYIGEPEPQWLSHYVDTKRLTRLEADDLLVWVANYRLQIEYCEAQEVRYQAEAGEVLEAIVAFGRLMRRCFRDAGQAERMEYRGWHLGHAKAVFVRQVSREVQSRVMGYLPLHIATAEEHNLLRQVLDRYGWHKRAV